MAFSEMVSVLDLPSASTALLFCIPTVQQSTGGFGCHEGQSSRGQLSTDNPALHLRLWGCPDAVLLFLHGHMQTIAFAQDGLAESTCMQICAGKSMKKERGFILIPLIYSHQMSVQCHIKIFNDFKTNGP